MRSRQTNIKEIKDNHKTFFFLKKECRIIKL